MPNYCSIASTRLSFIIIIIIELSFDRRQFDLKDLLVSRKTQLPFGMAIGNVELMHERFPKHLIAHGNSKNEIIQRNRGRMFRWEKLLMGNLGKHARA